MCKHPRVQIVAREEDVEFVECVECGEIFEASEFRDMAIEDRTAAEDSWLPPDPMLAAPASPVWLACHLCVKQPKSTILREIGL